MANLSFEDRLAQELGLAGYGVTQKRGPAAPATRKYYSQHEGTDFGTPAGTPVKPNFSGIYKGSYDDQTGYGKRAVIYNPQTNETLYLSHLSGVANLKPGQTFQAGTPVAYTGGIPGTPGAGNTTGQHLDVVTQGGQGNTYNFASALANAAKTAQSAATGAWRGMNPMDVINKVKQQFGKSAAAVASDPNKLKQIAGNYKNARIVKIRV